VIIRGHRRPSRTHQGEGPTDHEADHLCCEPPAASHPRMVTSLDELHHRDAGSVYCRTSARWAASVEKREAGVASVSAPAPAPAPAKRQHRRSEVARDILHVRLRGRSRFRGSAREVPLATGWEPRTVTAPTRPGDRAMCVAA
jgi:hypothetical protein